MAQKTKFSLGSKILYTILVMLILAMFWPTSRTFIQQSLMKIGLFKPKIEQPNKSSEQTEISTLSNAEQASFTDENNQTFSTADLKGKVVFINFWATWCGPCVAEMPSIEKLRNHFKDNEEVEFLLVEIEEDIALAKEFMTKHNLSLPVHIPAGSIPGEWLKGAIPSTVVLNKDGKRVFMHEGMADYSDKQFVNFIQQLSEE